MTIKRIYIKRVLLFLIVLLSVFSISKVYCRYSDTYTKVVNLNIRKPNFVLVFHKNDPSGETVSGTMNSQTFTYGTAQNIDNVGFTLTGFSFVHWNTAADDSGTSYSNGQSISNLSSVDGAAIDLYAIWQANTYSVTLNANGGSVSGSPLTVTYHQAYGTLPTPTRSGYTFFGWYKESTFTNKVTASTIVNTASNHTLYAKWVQNPFINDVSTVTMTQAQAAKYYGQVVSTVGGSSFNPNSSDTRTWRVFYIDTANKYGDGKGTIYLKADNDSNKVIRFNTVNSATDSGGYESVFSANNIVRKINGTSTNSTVSVNRYHHIANGKVVNSSGTVINTKYLELNPTYATGRISYSSTYSSSANFFNMEKAAAYLCDPTYFSAYKDNNRTNYAIGSPPLEMYIDSWNAKFSSNKMKYRFNTQVDGTNGSQKLPGYQLYPSEGAWGTVTADVDLNALDTTGMYKTTSGLWLASPAIIYKGGSLIRVSSSSTVGIGNATINMFYEFSPVVSLVNTTYVYTTSYTGSYFP